MDKKFYHKLLDDMFKGKSFRMTKKCREESKNSNIYFTDTWFTILSINTDGRVTMCGNLDSIFQNYSVDDFVFE
jgi:MoaA/NifB/PqqE/SkfB family radical SAM enzyme